MGNYPDIETIKAILLKENYISADDSQAAETTARTGGDYVNFLIREDLLSKPLLGQALGEAYKIPFIDMSSVTVSKENLALLPENEARANRAVVAKVSSSAIGLVTDSPSEVDRKALQKHFKDKTIKLGYALPEAIDAALDAYEQPLETRFQSIIDQNHRVAPEIVDEIISDAIRFNASDIHFEPAEAYAKIRFRVDGSLRVAGKIPSEYYENILNRIKVESGMRIDEHMSAQDGAMRRKNETMSVDLRVSLIPTVLGEKIVMRVLGSYVQSFGLDDIGLSQPHRERLETYANKPFGMILTVGPTGSGKTTTLYSILKLLNHPNINITTIEDPVEYKMAGISQIQVRNESNMTFARGLRAIVRQDPDVILVGEIRDNETAEISVNAALTGHLLLSTFHANDAATAIPRLIDLGIEPFLLSSTLQIVIAQRLVRKLCAACRYSATLAQAMTHVASGTDAAIAHYFKARDTVYEGKGCAACNGTGFKGRIALYEFIEMTPQLQELILSSPSARAIETLARSHGSTPMFEDGIAKIKSGETTISELVRTVEPPLLVSVHHGKAK